MPEMNGRLPELEQPDRDPVDPQGELSEADLECVVGGLARPWTETEADEWLVDAAVRLL